MTIRYICDNCGKEGDATNQIGYAIKRDYCDECAVIAKGYMDECNAARIEAAESWEEARRAAAENILVKHKNFKFPDAK